MAINAVNTTGAPNELYRAVDIAGGAVGDYGFKLASTLDGGTYHRCKTFWLYSK